MTKMLTENCKSEQFCPQLSSKLSDLSGINVGKTTDGVYHPTS